MSKLGTFHSYPDIFENGDFFLLFSLSAVHTFTAFSGINSAGFQDFPQTGVFKIADFLFGSVFEYTERLLSTGAATLLLQHCALRKFSVIEG